jgi:hypothetical protein
VSEDQLCGTRFTWPVLDKRLEGVRALLVWVGVVQICLEDE